MTMNSIYYVQAWKDLYGVDNAWYAVTTHPLAPLYKLLSATLSLTIVDTNYEYVKQEIYRNKHFRQRIDVQNCPDDLKNHLLEKGFMCKARGTYIINLQRSEKELWEGIRKEARKLINKTELAGCTVTLCESIMELKQYYTIVKTARKKMGFGTASFRSLKKQWNALHPNYFHVFLAKDKNGIILGGMGLLYTQEYMIEVIAGMSERARTEHLYINDLLKWNMIKWGREQGIKYYDLAGVDVNAPVGSKEHNIFVFKSKWGGDYYEWLFFTRENNKYLYQRVLKKIIGGES